MKILALDLGSNVGLFDGTWPRVWTLAGSRHEKLGQFHAKALQKASGFWACNIWLYERPFTRGLAATRLLWGMAGIIDALSIKMGATVLDIPPTAIKKWATGSGKATKEQMIQQAAVLSGLTVTNEHVADAICLHAYALANIQSGD